MPHHRNGGLYIFDGAVGIALRYFADLPMGKTSSRLECGRGMTCTEISSPTRRAAAAPASVAARTEATSPRTSTVTYPDPIFSHPTICTFAAFTIASAASIMATIPRVSIIPRASPMNLLNNHRAQHSDCDYSILCEHVPSFTVGVRCRKPE